MTKFCSECGSPIADTAKFCENCGASCPESAAESAPVPVPAQAPAAPQPPSEGQPAGGIRQPAPQPRYAMPINADRRASAPAAPDANGASEEKGHFKLGVGVVVGVAVLIVLLITAIIIIFAVWKPFEKKNDTSAPSGDSAATEYVSDVPAQSDTFASGASETQPVELPGGIGGGTSIDDVLNRVTKNIYSYNRSADDLVLLLYEYCYPLSTSDKQDIYDAYTRELSSTSDLDELAEEFGADFVVTVTVTESERFTGDDLDSTLEYYGEVCDVSGIEEVWYVSFDAHIEGSLGSADDSASGYFIKANGRWYTDTDLI